MQIGRVLTRVQLVRQHQVFALDHGIGCFKGGQPASSTSAASSPIAALCENILRIVYVMWDGRVRSSSFNAIRWPGLQHCRLPQQARR